MGYMAIKAVTSINESLNKLQAALIQSADACKGYKEFYEKCTNTSCNPISVKDQRYFASNMFSMITNHDLEKLETEFQGIKSQVIILDARENEQFSSKIESIAAQFEKCKGNVETFKSETIKCIQNSADLLVDDQGCLFGTMVNECHCCPLMDRSNRNSFSLALTYAIEKKWPDKKELTIASIGCGGCFHELEIHALLAQKGCKVNWVLVDPMLFPTNISRFKMIAQWATPGINVLPSNEKAETYFDSFRNPDPNTPLPDVFLFIDIGQHVGRKTIADFQPKVSHPCLFADYNKRNANTDFWWDATNIDGINFPKN